MDKLRRVLTYLSNTANQKLRMRPPDVENITVYVDASYAVHDDRKSHSGYTIAIGKEFHGPIYSRSAKQKHTARSSTEAELIALDESILQVIWTRNLMIELGYPMKPAIVHQDNQSTMILAEKGMSTSKRTKHIEVRHFYIKEKLDLGEITLVYTPTNQMVADILTKPLQGSLHQNLRDKLIGFSN